MKKIKFISLVFFFIPMILHAQINSNEQKAKESLQKADNAYTNDFFELALTYYKEAESLYSKVFDAESYYNMGLAYAYLENYQQAITCFQKAISINSNYAEAYGDMGNAYDELTNYHQAITCFQKAISINPNYANAYYNMGITYAHLENYQQAIPCFQKAAKLGLREAQKLLQENGISW